MLECLLCHLLILVLGILKYYVVVLGTEKTELLDVQFGVSFVRPFVRSFALLRCCVALADS